MGRGSGKRATRRRVADLAASSRDDDAKLERVTARRLAKLEKDLAAAHRAAERHQSRLAAASAEADRIRGEIAGLLRHASDPAMGGARKVGHAAADLIEDAADVVADAAGGVVHAAGSVVGRARRSVRTKARVESEATPAPPATAAVETTEPAASATEDDEPGAKPKRSATKPRKPAAPAASRPDRPATPRPRRAPSATPRATGPDNG